MPLTCPQCGSERIVPAAKVISGSDTFTHLEVTAMLHEHPDALMFKNAASGPLTARVCGECGHTELHTKNAALLFKGYRQTIEKGGSGDAS